MARKKVAKRLNRAKRLKAKAEKKAKEEEKEEEEDLEEEDEELEEKEDEEEDEEEEEEGEALELPEYTPSPKPKISNDVKKAMKLRKAKKQKQPKFIRQEGHRYKKLGMKWRKPRGMHSKMRIGKIYRQNIVSIGYRGPKKARYLHPSGFKEVLVHNLKEVEAVDPVTEAIRIAHGVGTKKREAIEERVQELEDKKDVKYYILNRLKKYDIVTIYQPSDLEGLDRREQAAFIHPNVGKKVRKAIIEKAKEMSESKKGGIKVLNVKKGVMD